MARSTESGAERERSGLNTACRLDMVRAREAGENSRDSEVARDRAQSIAGE